jgi:hypothetical protein
MSYGKRIGWLLLTAVLLPATGCASRDRWLDCESDLEPINTPAPLVRDEMSGSKDKASIPGPERGR